jgi:penicillin-binding protein-related factor A (putative recombinase)
MLNHFVGIQKEILGSDDLSKIYQGTMIEHLTGQELLADQYNALSELFFWVKEKKESTAEVDFLISFEGKIIPIETKSGKTGTLKSLHLFMDAAPHNMAVRFYAGDVIISEVKSAQNKTFFLLNLPYYLVSKLKEYLIWFQEQIQQKQIEIVLLPDEL